jgi:hypothetical protein
MDTPPETIGGARVVKWVTLNSGTAGHSENVSRLAICHDDDEEAFYLFHCDDLWQVVWDSWHETVEEAVVQADSQYMGLSGVWRAV